jgi:hypothetical protein
MLGVFHDKLHPGSCRQFHPIAPYCTLLHLKKYLIECLVRLRAFRLDLGNLSLRAVLRPSQSRRSRAVKPDRKASRRRINERRIAKA